MRRERRFDWFFKFIYNKKTTFFNFNNNERKFQSYLYTVHRERERERVGVEK